MMKLSGVSWLTDAQREVLAEHHVLTMEQLASFELRDSMADVIPVDGLRQLAKRARRSLGHDDPMAMIGAAVGQRGPVRYAGNVRFGGEDGRD